MDLTHSIVIATRNRPEALSLSLPLLISQSRRADRILIVDSSDPAPFAKTAELVADLGAGPVPVLHQEAPRGASLQRNIGLEQVDSDVVFFPDDDSLYHPGTVEMMMRIYERDEDRLIGGVCSAEARRPPEGVLDQAKAYEMRRSDRLKAAIAHRRRRLEDVLVPHPYHQVSDRKYARLPSGPAWLHEENAILVPWMTGFRMSFRTESIRRHGFCEALGHYALCEDIDAGFSVLDHQLLVGARNAQIYHHKAPARRANGRAIGAMNILNRAFIIARSGEATRSVQRAYFRHSRYKLAQYLVGRSRGGAFARERYQGARAALSLAPILFETPPERLTEVYLELRAQCFTAED